MAYDNSFRACLKNHSYNLYTPSDSCEKIEYSDNNKMNSVKTKKTDDKILNLENQRKI